MSFSRILNKIIAYETTLELKQVAASFLIVLIYRCHQDGLIVLSLMQTIQKVEVRLPERLVDFRENIVQNRRLDIYPAFAGKTKQKAAFAGVSLVWQAAKSGCLVSV